MPPKKKLPSDVVHIVRDFEGRGSLELINRTLANMEAYIEQNPSKQQDPDLDLVTQQRATFRQTYGTLIQQVEHSWGGAGNVPAIIRAPLDNYVRIYNEYLGDLNETVERAESADAFVEGRGMGKRSSYQQFVKDNFIQRKEALHKRK